MKIIILLFDINCGSQAIKSLAIMTQFIGVPHRTENKGRMQCGRGQRHNFEPSLIVAGTSVHL